MKITDKANESLLQLVTLFEKGDVPNAVASVTLKAKEMPMGRWSLGNRLLVFIQGCIDARAFGQWRDVERSIIQGAKAKYILAPLLKKMEVRNQVNEEEEAKNILLGFKVLPVFDLTQTSGKPLTELQPITPPPLLEVAKAWGLNVEYCSRNNQFLGVYLLESNKIFLATYDHRTFFHELTHAADARNYQLINGQNPIQEIVAELTAASLSEMYGIQNEQSNHGNSYQYIKRYAEEANTSVTLICWKVLTRVGQALNEILQSVEEGTNQIS